MTAPRRARARACSGPGGGRISADDVVRYLQHNLRHPLVTREVAKKVHEEAEDTRLVDGGGVVDSGGNAVEKWERKGRGKGEKRLRVCDCGKEEGHQRANPLLWRCGGGGEGSLLFLCGTQHRRISGDRCATDTETRLHRPVLSLRVPGPPADIRPQRHRHRERRLGVVAARLLHLVLLPGLAAAALLSGERGGGELESAVVFPSSGGEVGTGGLAWAEESEERLAAASLMCHENRAREGMGQRSHDS